MHLKTIRKSEVGKKYGTRDSEPMRVLKAHSKPSQISKMELFAKIVYGFDLVLNAYLCTM